ncbi:SRPBCC family protein [Nocardioides daphniae]|nr:SRPBCC family protein [Nocardioides daphniae]GGD18506.1 hypothetical protein GCM10007231_17040 [Nocardioides daphniae]
MRGQLRIARPREVVFDAAVDEPSWNPAISSVEWLTPPPVGAGSRYRAVFGKRWVTDVELVELERPHLLRSRSTSSWLWSDGPLTFREEGPGVTVMSWDWEYRLLGRARVLAPLFRLVGGRWERANWKRMRDHVERQEP